LISTKTIIDKVSILLQDTSNVRWSTDELLGWLNIGQGVIVILKPDANVVKTDVQLAAGTSQSLPDGSSTYQDHSGATLRAGLYLLALTRNLGVGGTTPGKSIRIIDQDLLDAMDPDWASADASAVVSHYMYNEKLPQIFSVYPPQPTSGQGYVEIVYSALPTACASYGASTYIDLPDHYESALIDYILYRAYSKDGDAADSAGRAAAYYNTFLDTLGRQDLKEQEVDPNLRVNPSPSLK